MTYETKQPYLHQVYSAKIGHFDIEIDIKSEGNISKIIINSSISDVVFFFNKFTTTLGFNDSCDYYLGDTFIQLVANISNDRLNELYARVSE